MQRHARSLRKALQSMRDHLRTQVADLLPSEAKVDNSPRSAGQVNHGPGECLVERRIAATESLEGLSGTEGLCEGLAQCEEGVFCCVVVVDWRWLVLALVLTIAFHIVKFMVYGL